MTALMVGAALSLPLLSVRAAETNTPLTTIPSDSNYKSHYVFNKTVSYFDLASKMTPVGDSWTGLRQQRLRLTPGRLRTVGLRNGKPCCCKTHFAENP